MPIRERVDLSIYLRAFGVFARNPTVIVLPLVVGVFAVLVRQVGGMTGTDPVTGGLISFIIALVQLFALGVSIIIADAGWRRGVASFDDAWQEARRKAGDIFFAAFGLTFVVQIALLAGRFFGASIGLLLVGLAIYGLIFTIPAAAIGGLPGGAALNASVERVRAYPLTAAVLAIVTIVLVLAFGWYIAPSIDALVFESLNAPPILAPLLDALVSSIGAGYIATVSAKVYAEVAFSRRW